MAKRNIGDSDELKKLAQEFEKMQATSGRPAPPEDPMATPTYTEPPKKRMNPAIVILVSSVILIVAVVAIVLMVMSKQRQGGIVVPDVVGKTESEAKSTLTGQGFRVTPQYDRASTKPVGTVISSNPQGGMKVADGAEVVIKVSGTGPTGVVPNNQTPLRPPPPTSVNSGSPAPSQAVIPDVTGMVEEKAAKMLSDLGLKSETVKVQDMRQPDRIVISCSPKPGTQVMAGAVVRLSVNALPATANNTNNNGGNTNNGGANNNQIVLKNYVGQDGRDAGVDLIEQGFQVEWVYEKTRLQPTGYVVRTVPAANTALPRGSKVTVVLVQ